MHSRHLWHNWTFNFKPHNADILLAAMQVDKGENGNDTDTCLQYLNDALSAAQITPADWWEKYGQSVYHLMMLDITGKHLPDNDLGRFEAKPSDIIPWLNQKLGLLQQASLPKNKKQVIDFLLTWSECTQIEENPRCD